MYYSRPGWSTTDTKGRNLLFRPLHLPIVVAAVYKLTGSLGQHIVVDQGTELPIISNFAI